MAGVLLFLEETMATTRQLFRPLDVVNEVAARVVAAQVALATVVALVLDQPWLLLLLLHDFAVRALGRPRLSPLAQLATHVWLPILGRPFHATPAAPKRFAAAIGLVVSGAALALWTALGQPLAAQALLALLLVFAVLEAALAFCAGCWLFAQLVRVGVLPAVVCESCASVDAPTPEAS
jgi:hypothetical protein